MYIKMFYKNVISFITMIFIYMYPSSIYMILKMFYKNVISFITMIFIRYKHFILLVIYMFELKVVSNRRNEMIDITNDVQNILDQKNLQEGHIIVYVPHTTAGITINEGADPSVQRDIIETLKRIIPEKGNYHHLEGNSDAHIKASIIGSSVNVIVEKNRLVLGTWQHIFFYEGDGPRKRIVYVELVSS